MSAVVAAEGGRLLAGLRRIMPRTRLHPVIMITLGMWLVSTIGVMIGWADGNGKPTQPVGLGGLMPMPDLTNGGTKSLFESTGYLAWTTDGVFGRTDIYQPIIQSLSSSIWMFAVFLVYGAIGLVYWLLSVASFNTITAPLSDAIGASASELLAWLLPSALVIGLLWAWIRNKGAGLMSAISWTIAAAVLGASLAIVPTLWIDGVNNTRTVGTDAIMTMTSNAVSPNQQKPFPWPATNYGAASGDAVCNIATGQCNATGNQTPKQRQNVMLRKTGDAVWRALVATPWCIEEFGSMQACQRYGADMIKLGSNLDARKDYINKTISYQEGGDDAPTVKWTKGYNTGDRLIIALFSLVVNIVFCGVILVLGFTALSALISTFFHLFMGVPFTLTWCIEGRPRQIGLRWLEGLIGSIIQSLVATATFGALLVLLTVQFSLMASLGWLPTIITAVVMSLSALSFRRHVMSFFGVIAGGNRGAALLGALALRQLSRITRGAGRAGTSAARGLSSRSSRAAASDGVLTPAGGLSRQTESAAPAPRARADRPTSGRPRRRPSVIGASAAAGGSAPTGRAPEARQDGNGAQRPAQAAPTAPPRRRPTSQTTNGQRANPAPRRTSRPGRGTGDSAAYQASRRQAAEARDRGREVDRTAGQTKSTAQRIDRTEQVTVSKARQADRSASTSQQAARQARTPASPSQSAAQRQRAEQPAPAPKPTRREVLAGESRPVAKRQRQPQSRVVNRRTTRTTRTARTDTQPTVGTPRRRRRRGDDRA